MPESGRALGQVEEIDTINGSSLAVYSCVVHW